MKKSKEIDKSSEALKTFMRFRKQTAIEISEHTKISEKTIRGYMQGKPPFRKASAEKFLAITNYMEVDPYYMLGKEEWDISEYICEKYGIQSLREVATLTESQRLTKNTKKLRDIKKRIIKITYNVILKPVSACIENLVMIGRIRK